jgi:hypothetical protein
MAMAVDTTKAGKPFDPRSVELPSMGALVGFYHACVGFPVKQTWLKAIKAGNFNSLPGLTYANASRYCPDADETIKGHLAQQRQNVRSTKPKPLATEPPTVTPAIPQGEKPLLFVKTFSISKLYTDDTGRFPIRAQSGNQYVMIAYHEEGNLILQQPFKSKKDVHRIAAYNAIMTRLAAKGLNVDMQILDNEASAAYKQVITEKWKATFQLVPPDVHQRNRAERAIRTFKDHFLAILAGVDPKFPPYLWDLLLPQSELTLNLLRQSLINPRISAWDFFQGPFDFDKTPLAPSGCRVLIHAKPATRRSWDFRAKDGFYIGPALESYRCFKLVKCDTQSQVISDTVEFRHAFRNKPTPSPEDKIINGLQVMASALANAPQPTSVTQLEAIATLRDLFGAWKAQGTPGTARQAKPVPQPPRVEHQQTPRVVTPIQQQLPPPPPTPIPLPTPRKLNFDNLSPPRVDLPQQNTRPAQRPPRSPIMTRSRTRMPEPLVGPKVKPLALNTLAGPYYQRVKYMIPMPKSVQRDEE